MFVTNEKEKPFFVVAEHHYDRLRLLLLETSVFHLFHPILQNLGLGFSESKRMLKFKEFHQDRMKEDQKVKCTWYHAIIKIHIGQTASLEGAEPLDCIKLLLEKL